MNKKLIALTILPAFAIGLAACDNDSTPEKTNSPAMTSPAMSSPATSGPAMSSPAMSK